MSSILIDAIRDTAKFKAFIKDKDSGRRCIHGVPVSDIHAGVGCEGCFQEEFTRLLRRGLSPKELSIELAELKARLKPK